MNNAGGVLKALRQARGVSLSELHTKRSAASISRFERGEIDLTYDVLSDILTTLGVDYHDLMLMGVVSDTAKNDWAHLPDDNWNADAVRRIERQLKSHIVDNVKNPFLEMAIEVLDELLGLHQSLQQELSPKLIHHLIAYYQPLSEWSRVEGIILLAVVEYTPAPKFRELIAPKVRALLSDSKLESDLQIRQVISLCSGLAARAGIDNNLELMNESILWMAALNQKTAENPISRYNYLVMKRLFELKQADTQSSRQNLVAILKTGRVILPGGGYDYFKNYAIQQKWLNEEDFVSE